MRTCCICSCRTLCSAALRFVASSCEATTRACPRSPGGSRACSQTNRATTAWFTVTRGHQSMPTVTRGQQSMPWHACKSDVRAAAGTAPHAQPLPEQLLCCPLLAATACNLERHVAYCCRLQSAHTLTRLRTPHSRLLACAPPPAPWTDCAVPPCPPPPPGGRDQAGRSAGAALEASGAVARAARQTGRKGGACMPQVGAGGTGRVTSDAVLQLRWRSS